MNEQIIEAAYLPGIGCPALRIGDVTYTRTIEQMEQLITEMQHAVLRARIDERNCLTRVRATSPSSSASEV